MFMFVDADSFPVPARAVICRAAIRRALPLLFVGRNRLPDLPRHKLLRFRQAEPGEGSADAIILAQARPGDLVFTRDIPLAARLVEAGVLVLNDRGQVWTAENVRERLSERDFMSALRDADLAGFGARQYGQRELADFANAFDRVLTRLLGPAASGP